ncbi:MAG: AAA family ATPase [Elusimicrobia bacterium]|nr:AAA family ATPase [Elusimicrobiota bacterium]
MYDTGMIDGGSDISSSQAQAGTEEKNPFLQKEKLVQDIDQIQKELDQLQKENESRQNRLTEQQLSFNEKKSALDKQALQKNMAQEIWNKKNEELSLSVREKQVLQEKLDQDKKEQCEHQQALQLIEAKLENLQSDQRKREEERTELERQIEEKRQEEHRFELRAKEAEIRLESFLENVRRNEESLEEWRNRLEEISHNVQDAEEEIEVFREQCLRMGKIQKDETLKIQNLQSEKTKVSAETESILKRKNELESLVWATQETVQKCRETQKTLSEISHGAELELRTSENEKKNILNRLQDNYQLTLESAQEQFPLNPVDAEEIARLKKRVESLSHSVNLEAPEQYKSLQERYQFLDTQMQDLQKAKEDLRSAIQQINHTTREQFKQTFAKVQENFKTVYSQLFEGGVANLIFTDPENILDSGIDIVAQPAGKKLQNIALLSGGEKTLTAIALLFAFFMVKPSPTCILDEVDAPLDPANVNRYLSLLKDFAQKTQFIAVTHNAKTMESADILYGVTMEESGVSRLLSVRLKKENSQTSVALLPA